MSSPTQLARATLHLLVTKVRAISLDQLRSSQTCPRRSLQAAMRRLEQHGLVVRHTVLMEPILDLHGPVATWLPGEAAPNLGNVSWQLRTRWRAPLKRMTVYAATARACRHLAGTIGGRPLRASEIRHDCHVAEVYRKLTAYRPEIETQWIPEDAFALQNPAPFRGDRVPDAMLATIPAVAIEFGGSYRTPKLLSFHRAMAAQEIPYEIW